MLRVWLLLVVTACGRIGFGDQAAPGDASTGGNEDTAGLQPIHQYSFNGNFRDDLGGPDAVGRGGTFSTRGYQFAPNQGPSVDGALPPDVYTVDIEFAFADATGWRKILDYEGLTRDSGFYTYQNALQFVIVPGSDFLTAPRTFTPDTTVRVSLTRSAAGHVVAYLDGAPAFAIRASSPDPPSAMPLTRFEFDDPARVAALTGNTATFFVDDAATSGGEAAMGTVRRIRIYDVVLGANQIAAIGN